MVDKVVWKKYSTIKDICNTYIKDVRKHYYKKSYRIAFDGYTDLENSMKVAE